jgi:hypothetical protein
MGFTDRLTELEATNVILRSASLSDVISVDPAPSTATDAGQAYAALQEAAKRLNAIGWAWNTEYDVELALDGASPNTITVTADVISIRNTYNDEPPVVLRGLTLFDRSDNTTSFKAPVSVDLVRLIAWDDMPEEARWAALYTANETFLMRSYPGSDEINRIRAEKEAAVAQLQAREAEMGRNNLYNNYDVLRAFYRPWPMGDGI